MLSVQQNELRQTGIRTDASAAQRAADQRPRGYRVFTAGHSFHVFVAPLLAELARSAGINGHVAAGTQFLGGSRVIEHWERSDSLNEAKRALRGGGVDVLTLSPLFHPDPGIGYFVRLAVKHNPDVRITIQASWVPFDGLLAAAFQSGKGGRDHVIGADLRVLHVPCFQSLDDEVRSLQKQYHGKSVLSVVPVGQALIALREHITAGRAPGLHSQQELFTDDLGHPALPVQFLAAYAHFAVIYRQSPVGLPPLRGVGQARNPGCGDGLNRLLQELAWEAVRRHPLSGLPGGS